MNSKIILSAILCLSLIPVILNASQAPTPKSGGASSSGFKTLHELGDKTLAIIAQTTVTLNESTTRLSTAIASLKEITSISLDGYKKATASCTTCMAAGSMLYTGISCTNCCCLVASVYILDPQGVENAARTGVKYLSNNSQSSAHDAPQPKPKTDDMKKD